MRVEVFALCDAATVDSGKLNILGAFDTISVNQDLPAFCPQCAIALRVRFESIERGEHKVAVHFADIDGKKVIPAALGSLQVNFPDEQRSTSTNMILNIQGLKLEKLGEYSIDLAIDGQAKASLPLFLKKRGS